MKHIVKVNNIQEAKDSTIRPIIALDNNGILFFEKKMNEPQIEFVDLGLSVKFGKSLLGATNGDTAESWYGNYYAWSEIETKLDYAWSTYKYVNSSQNKLTKYCSKPIFGNNGFTDNLTQLVPEDDVATQTNPAWRMPTKAELEELKALPNEWITNYKGISGLNGRLFTAKNGNTLFIPAAGYSGKYLIGSSCDLWSSSLDSTSPNSAFEFSFNSDYVSVNSGERRHGYCVSPVLR